MAHAIAAGLLTPVHWLSRLFSTEDAAVVSSVAATPVTMGGDRLCGICHENPAPASTDYRCIDCWLDCNAAP